LLRAEEGAECCFLSLTLSLVSTGGEGGEAGVQVVGDRLGEIVSVALFTLLLLVLLVVVGMSIGTEEGEVEREGIAAVLLERMAGREVAREGVGGVEERICTGSLSISSNAGGSWSKSISMCNLYYLFLGACCFCKVRV
jgi:hypothetical protein